MPRFPKSVPPGILGTAALLALVLVFLAGLLGEEGHWRLSSAGLLQEHELTRVDPPARTLGRAELAAAVRSEPWAMLDRREIHEGRAPLWNPWNGGGRPHLANAGTASFSPFAIPGYLFEPRVGNAVTAALELFALALFAFLLLRELGASVLAAIVGATAFAFAGSQLHPLATARAGALAAVPSALYFTEKTLRSVHRVLLGAPGERRATARVRGPLAGLCLTFVIGSLCGSPATLALAAALAGAWTVARGLPIALEARAAERFLFPLALASAKAALALLLAAGLASFRWLGWIELVDHAEIGAPSTASLPPRAVPWSLFFFPNALGEAAASAILPVHVGAIVLFLALISLAFARRDPRIATFLALGILCAAAATGAAPVLRVLAALGVPSDEAGQGGWSLCVACAIGLGVDRIAKSDSPRSWLPAILTALAGIAFLAAFRLGLERVPGFDSTAAAPHLRQMAVVFAVGIVATCLLWVARDGRTRLVAGAGLTLGVFLGGGRALQDSVPRCEERAAFPWTASARALRDRVGSDRVVVLGDDTLPPDANIAYEIAVLPSRGGTELASFARLLRHSFPGSEVHGPIRSVSERSLSTFGVRWVLAREPFELARVHPDAFARVHASGEFGLYRYTRSLGRSWLVPRSVRVNSVDRAFALVQDDAFDPARVVVLGPADEIEETEAEVDTPLESTLAARVADLPRSTDPPPKWAEIEPTWLRIEVDCSSPQFLVLAHTWYPGWSVRVNGIPCPLLRANGAFMAVEVPRGLSVVELSYEPQNIEIGLWIAIASGLFGLLCLFHRPFA